MSTVRRRSIAQQLASALPGQLVLVVTCGNCLRLCCPESSEDASRRIHHPCFALRPRRLQLDLHGPPHEVPARVHAPPGGRASANLDVDAFHRHPPAGEGPAERTAQKALRAFRTQPPHKDLAVGVSTHGVHRARVNGGLPPGPAPWTVATPWTVDTSLRFPTRTSNSFLGLRSPAPADRIFPTGSGVHRPAPRDPRPSDAPNASGPRATNAPIQRHFRLPM